MGEAVGVVAEVWRFPVKSMGGESLEAAELEAGGIAGDRAYALVDVETDKLVSAKNVRQFPDILQCRASYLAPPEPGMPPPPVRIELPDGAVVTSGGGEAEAALSALYGRPVRLARAAPAAAGVFDEGAPGSLGRRVLTAQQKAVAAFLADAGLAAPPATSGFFDAFPASVITTSTLRRLAALQPRSRFDPRRFRMNVVVETEGAAFLENAWPGSSLSVGDRARLGVAIPDPRCVMTTLPQGDLERDAEILEALTRHNGLEVGRAGRMPCAGVYAVVHEAGRIKLGDPVSIGAA